jgi:small subunit ribosomal protein S13
MYQFFITIRFKKKSVSQTLISVSNIGKKKISFICKATGMLELAPFDSLTDFQLKEVAKWVESKFRGKHSVGQSFKKVRKERLIFLIKLGHIKGIRLKNRLPVRGQRTHTNAKTCRRISIE